MSTAVKSRLTRLVIALLGLTATLVFADPAWAKPLPSAALRRAHFLHHTAAAAPQAATLGSALSLALAAIVVALVALAVGLWVLPQGAARRNAPNAPAQAPGSRSTRRAA